VLHAAFRRTDCSGRRFVRDAPGALQLEMLATSDRAGIERPCRLIRLPTDAPQQRSVSHDIV